MEETKPVREIIEEVQAEICDNYCKYTDGYKEIDKVNEIPPVQKRKGPDPYTLSGISVP